MQNYIAMRNLKCAIQITHRDVILRTNGPKYLHSNDHSNCAIQVMHRDVILHTHGPKYRHSNDNSNCAIRTNDNSNSALLLSCENSLRYSKIPDMI